MCFVPFPGPSSSGDQMLGECTIPGELCVLISSPVLATRFPRCAVRALSQVCRVSPLGSWSSSVTLLVGVYRSGSRKMWLATRSLPTVWWKMLSLEPRLPLAFWLWLSPAHPSASGWLSFGILSSFVLIWASLSVRALHGKVLCLYFVLSLWPSLSVGCYLTLGPSDCPQGI